MQNLFFFFMGGGEAFYGWWFSLERATETHREYIVGADQYVDVCSLEGEWRETKRRERERDMAKGRGEVYDWGVARWKQPE